MTTVATDGGGPPTTTKRRSRRSTAALVVLALGVAVAVGAPIWGDSLFLLGRVSLWFPQSKVTFEQGDDGSTRRIEDNSPREFVTWTTRDALSLVNSEPAWTVCAAALVLVPLWFLWWRRTAMSFARAIGILASAATSGALVALTWDAPAFCAAHVMVGAPVAYLGAFVVAPSPTGTSGIGD